MAQIAFVNLPVKDLNRSVEFFTALGFGFNEQFTDENATCMIVNEGAYVMLLAERFFETFVSKTIADASCQTEVLIALSCDSREQVDDTVRRALAAGGMPSNGPKDEGFMYGWSFQDPDGHNWELVYMKPSIDYEMKLF